MTRLTVDTHVASPVDRVFAAFTDLAHSAERVSNIQKIELLTIGDFKLGTRWLETRKVLGHLDSAEMEVTAFERNRTYTITHHKGGMAVDATFTFEPVDGDDPAQNFLPQAAPLPMYREPKAPGIRSETTRVQIEVVLGSHGLPPGLSAPVAWALAGKVRDQISRDLADLKQSLEPQPA